MKQTLTCLLLILGLYSQAQIGVGTTSPNSTLDVRGSLATKYTAFSAATTATATDNFLVFTGTSATTLTLPNATTCQGRIYWIKNTSSNSSTLTIATTASQTIDGLATWSLTQANKTLRVVSDGSNWLIASESMPGSTGTPWVQGGNSLSAIQKLGTTSNHDLPFITNNTEKMRLTTGGNLGVGTSTFNGSNPERFIADAGAGGSNFQNVIVGKGNTNSYAQLNIQNTNAGTSASSDVVATADNGNETTNYVDMGINSSANSSGAMGGANDAYLYNMGQNLLIGTGTASKSLVFMTGGTAQGTNERMRIDGSGNVGIGTAAPSNKLSIVGTNPLSLTGVQTGVSSDSVLMLSGGVVKKLHPSALGASNNAWTILGNAGTNPSTNFIGTTDAQAFVVKENNTQVGRFEANSIALGNGATTNNATHSYALGSSASISFNKTNATAIGNSSSVTVDNSQAIGNSATATGSNSIALGNGATVNSANATVLGPSASTGFSANGSLAMGFGANTNSQNAIAIGTNSNTGFSLSNPVTIGSNSLVNGNNSVAIGNTATVGFISNGTALGASTSVTGNNSTAVGYNTTVTAANALILGDRSNSSLAVGIGTESFSGSAREKLLVDAGASGGASYQNVIVGKGNTNSYAQLNIQNMNAGTTASSDVVATSDNGNETINYIDLGINSSANTSAGVLGGANTAYLYTTGNDFAIGNGSNNKNLNFFTTTGSTYTERMRITSTGNVGIANTAPSEKLDVTGNVRFSGALMPNNQAGTAGYVLVSSGAGVAPTWQDATGYIDNQAWIQDGNTFVSEKDFGTKSNHDIPFITNNTEKMRLTKTGSLGVGTSTFNVSNPEKFIADAGAGGTSFQNVIVGKGNTNSYAQLNIQNGSAGTAASSDVVATANNGNESINFIDMGINGGGNTSSGVLGGANTAYLYATGNDFVIGNSTNNKDISIYTTSGATSTERMRILSGGNVGVNTSTANSNFEVNGSNGSSITVTTASITLDATHSTVIISPSASTPAVTLPTAAAGARRIYTIVNQTALGRTISSYRDFTNTASTTIPANTSITIQSDGTNWYRIR